MFWRDFPTKKAAIEALQEIINAQPFKQAFEAPLISDLIVERHYFCSLRGLRPSRFRKIPSYGAYSFEGDFADALLDRPIGWHPVSWRKCMMPAPTEWAQIVRAMRDRCEPDKRSRRETYPVCESCGMSASAEVHHREPSFAAIALEVRSLVSDSDVKECLSGWDWFVKEDFALPEGHRITELFDLHHRDAVLQALCKTCHNRTKAKAGGE